MNSCKHINYPKNYLSLFNFGLFCLTFLLLVSSTFAASKAISLNGFQKAKHIKVLAVDKSYAYIKAQKTLPVVVLYSTFASKCPSCSKVNNDFYQLSLKNHKKFKFLFANIDKWGKAELTSNLYFRVNADHPETLILYQSKIIRKLIGADYQKMPGYLQATQRILAANRLELYGDRLGHGTFNAIVISDKYDKFLSKYLNNRDSYKALAVAYNKKNTWTASQKAGALSQEQANEKVMAKCVKRWKNREGSCKLYMVGNQYVHNKANSKVKLVSASISQEGNSTRIDKYALKQKLKLKDKAGKLAMAYAINDSGRWISSFVHSYKTQKGANDAALKGCKKRRKANNISQQCHLYNLGS